MRNIMVATDLSPRSDRALRRATLIARQTGAALSLIHVVDDDLPSRLIDTELEVALELLHEQVAAVREADGVLCTAEVVLGDPFDGIAQAVLKAPPDLLVIGPHRRRLLRDIFIGTTAQRVIRTVRCPILMANGPPTDLYRRILLTTDLSAGSRQALNVFAGLDLARQASQSLLYIFDAPALRLTLTDTLHGDDQTNYIEGERAQATQGLAVFAKGLDIHAAERVVRHQKASAAHEILDAAQETAADLVVVGTRGRTGIATLFMGSTAEEVLRKADHDVLAVPPKAND